MTPEKPELDFSVIIPTYNNSRRHYPNALMH